MQLVITCNRVVIVRGVRSKLRFKRIFLPLLISPRAFVDPRPHLAHGEIQIPIKAPISISLFADLKSSVRAALRPQLVRRAHLEISCDDSRCHLRFQFSAFPISDFSLPREITSEPVLNITFSPSRFEVLLSLRRVAFISTTFPIHKLKGPAFFCGVNASIVVGPKSRR
jgi:hypothetical protein